MHGSYPRRRTVSHTPPRHPLATSRKFHPLPPTRAISYYYCRYLRGIPITDLMRVADARVISYFPIADADPIAPVAVHRALTSYLSAPRSHTSPAYDHDELFGVDGCDVREMVIRYDFASMHRCMHGTSPGTPNQLLGHEGDIFLTGAPGAVLAMRWGDLAGARLSWQKAAEGWARLHSAVDAGRLDWALYMCSMRFSRASRSVALAMNDMEAVDGLLRHTLEGIAARSPGDGYAVTRFLTLVERKGVAGPGLGSWEHENFSWMSGPMQLFVARGVAALVDDEYDSVHEWLPSAAELSRATEFEVGWDGILMGRQQPMVLGALLCTKLKRWDEAAAMAADALKMLHQPLSRIEALRVLAIARAGKAQHTSTSAIAARRQAVDEARSSGYVLMEALTTGELLRALAAEVGAEEEATAVKESLKEVLARMGCGEDEAGRLLGGDVLASLD